MTPELGLFSLILALCCAVLLSIMPCIQKKLSIDVYYPLAVRLTKLEFLFTLLSIISLFLAFYYNDLSVQYVQQNSHQTLPIYYRLTAVWGSHEGSMLLWVFLFTTWRFWVSHKKADLSSQAHACILNILGMLSVGFILFVLFTSSPFLRYLPFIPMQGSDLNPLLQDPGLIFHPPLLYMGYVGLSIPFAAQLCTLFYPTQAQQLARWTRFWTLCAWAFLTVGIVLGSYWAYYELGWGGYWFWDPVENASFMPWLVTGALVHSLIVTEKRKIFQGWTVLLAIYAFGLSLIGTFLVRSGVLTSVHAFAVSPERGLYILIFLTLVLSSALAVFCGRVNKIKKQGQFNFASRELVLLINNLFLVVIASTILLGTLYPLIIDALFEEKISVGAPYFNAVFIPLVLPLAFIMGLAPNVKFYQDKLLPHVRAHASLLIILLGIMVYIGISTGSILFPAGVFVGCWVIGSTFKIAFQKFTHNQLKQSSTVGMLIAHLGVGIVILSLSLTSHLSKEKDVDLAVSDKLSFDRYTIEFANLKTVSGPNYEGVQGVFRVDESGKPSKILLPEKRYYVPRNLPMTETAISSNLFRDIYIALSEPTGEDSWAVRIYIKPFVVWIWLGGLLIAFGGAFSVTHLRKMNKPTIKDEIHGR